MLYYITPFKYSKPKTEDNPQYFYWNTIHTFFLNIFIYILFSFLHEEEQSLKHNETVTDQVLKAINKN